MKCDDITEKETTVLMYVYLVRARSGISTAVNFLFIVFIDSRAVLKLFRNQDLFLNKSPFFKRFFTLRYCITCLSL